MQICWLIEVTKNLTKGTNWLTSDYLSSAGETIVLYCCRELEAVSYMITNGGEEKLPTLQDTAGQSRTARHPQRLLLLLLSCKPAVHSLVLGSCCRCSQSQGRPPGLLPAPGDV